MATHVQTPSAVSGHAAAHHPSATRYFVIYAGLLVLTASTFGVSRLPIGQYHLIAAIAISCVKVSLVVLFFMHLLEAEGANKLIFSFAIFFVAVLLYFILEDVSHRWKPTNSHAAWMIQNTYIETPGEGHSGPVGEPNAADVKHK